MLGTLEHSTGNLIGKDTCQSLVYAYNCNRHINHKNVCRSSSCWKKTKVTHRRGVWSDACWNRNIEDHQRLHAWPKGPYGHNTATCEETHMRSPKETERTVWQEGEGVKGSSVGDKVLVKILAYEGKHKIADKVWGGCILSSRTAKTWYASI